VLQLRDSPCFLEEHLNIQTAKIAPVVLTGFVQDLEGHIAAKGGVMAPPDRSHAALPQE
jgi:hypothetical protein